MVIEVVDDVGLIRNAHEAHVGMGSRIDGAMRGRRGGRALMRIAVKHEVAARVDARSRRAGLFRGRSGMVGRAGCGRLSRGNLAGGPGRCGLNRAAVRGSVLGLRRGRPVGRCPGRTMAAMFGGRTRGMRRRVSLRRGRRIGPHGGVGGTRRRRIPCRRILTACRVRHAMGR